MDGVLRGLAIYLALLLIFRAVGNRTVGKITVFDLVLLLIISETTQEALIGEDFSLTQCLLMVCTLVGADLILSLVKRTSKRADRALDGHPVLLVVDGVPDEERMRAERVDLSDVLEAARASQGIDGLQDIRHAVLERNGEISVIPRSR